MKIYSDFAKTKEIKGDLDLGVVQAGETKDIIFYVLNDSEATLVDLIFSADNKEVKIISAPKILLSGQTDKLVINYTPDISIEKKLNVSLNIEGTKLI